MMTNLFSKIWLVMVLTMGVILSYGITADACGLIVPRRTPEIPRDVHLVNLDVKKATLDIKIDDQVARVIVDEVFHNPNNHRIEGTFLLPVERGTAVSDLSMWINGKETKGELLDRDRAWKTYSDIVRSMKDPALLEYAGTSLLKLRIFPIEANSDVKIKYAYTYRLTSDGGLTTYRHPWGTNKFSNKDLEQVVIKVALKSQIALKTIYSPTYPALDINRKGDHEAIITMEQTKVKPDKDFIIYYTVSEKDFGVNLVTYRKTSQDGYFMMLLAPKYITDRADRVKKDVVFVMDTSGSMQGEKVQQAKDALKYCVNSLTKGDRFNLITFSGSARQFKTGLQEINSSTRTEALKFVEAIEARGGTNIDEALQMALGMQDKTNGHPFMVVFMTDGLPTIGEQNPETILKNVQAKNTNQTRIFTFGVGYDVNTHLLDKIAEATKGAREYITPQDNIEVKVSNFYDKIAYPVLANVRLEAKGIEIYDRYPKALPDLFRGSQLVLFGRYKGDGHKLITLTGMVNDRQKKLEYEATFTTANETTDFIPVMWASSKIGYLLDEIRLHGVKQEVKNEIVKLATEFGIVTPYTSWLVIEDTRRHAARNRNEGLRGFDSIGKSGGFALGDAAEARTKQQSGPRAVTGSQVARQLQENEKDALEQAWQGDKKLETLGRSIRNQMVQQSDKNFYQGTDGNWYDASYDDKDKAKIQQVKFASEDYFELVKNHPSLRKYFSVGQQVVVCYAGNIYQVIP